MSPSPEHEHIAHLVDDYVHDLLEPADKALIENHLPTCESCQLTLKEAQSRLNAIVALKPTTFPSTEQIVSQTMNRIDQSETKPSTKSYLRRRWIHIAVGALAASILFLGAFHFHYEHLQASPINLELTSRSRFLIDTDAAVRMRLLDTKKNLPLRDVPVEIELVNPQSNEVVSLVKFNTDSEGGGPAKFRMPVVSDGDYRLRVSAQTSEGVEVVEKPVKLYRSMKIMLSTDKPVYQPGQVIQIRSLALRRPDLKPVTDSTATLTISDPKGNIIFKQQPKCSAYGIVSADCPLADEINEGQYSVTCRIADVESKVNVEVKPYILPKFKIDITLDKTYYRPQDTVKGKIKAQYFHGKPVVGEIALDAEPKVLSRVYRTDENGEATFECDLNPSHFPDRPNQPNSLFISATITDNAGQKVTRSVSRNVLFQDLLIDAVPENGNVVGFVKNRIFILVTTPDGQPVQATLKVDDQELKTDELGIAVWVREPMAFVGSSPVTPPPKGIYTGYVTVNISATDAKGRKAERQFNFLPATTGRDFLMQPNRSIYTAGDTVKVHFATGGNEPIFVDLLQSGQVIRTERVDIQNDQGDITFDLPPDWFGNMDLLAYRLGMDGQWIRRARSIFVKPAKQLNFHASLETPANPSVLLLTSGLGNSTVTHRPGQKARLMLTLTDDRGQPMPGAISFAAIDEAVFSVLEQRPGLESKFFLKEPSENNVPTPPIEDFGSSGIEIPPDRIEEVRQRWEGALFARTARVLPPIFPASLNVESLKIKNLAVDQRRENNLEWIHRGWRFSGILTGIGLVVGLIWGLHYLASMMTQGPAAWIMTASWLVVLGTIGLFFFLPYRSLKNETFDFVGSSIGTSDRWTASGGESTFLLQNPPTDWPEDPDFPLLLAIDNSGSMGDGTSNKLLQDSFGGALAGPGRGGSRPNIRIRKFFPETLLWKPQLITDDRGRVSVDIDLADSITTWRLTASGVNSQGQLGSWQSDLPVFQPFFVDVNLPIRLTRGDEITLPVVVSNYLKSPQKVKIALADSDWFERLDQAIQEVDLGANEVKAVNYRIKVTKVGKQSLQVVGSTGFVADAVKRTIEVVPDGRRIEHVVNGSLEKPVSVPLELPKGAIEGSAKVFVKVYPSGFSQLVEGLDGIFQMPHGCFEQTSSTTYPNILALNYLKQTKKNLPQIEFRARQYIHIGYQRLLSFEVPGGGFDWYGKAPANKTLTAYGLMEFRDMAKVHEVDPNIISRTRNWLIAQRKPNGSWDPDSWNPSHRQAAPVEGLDLARIQSTAYIAWSIYTGEQQNDSGPTQRYLSEVPIEKINDPYLLALMANAFLGMSDEDSGKKCLSRLEELKQKSPDGDQIWWGMDANQRTAFHGSGQSGDIETTSLVVLAQHRAKFSSFNVKPALRWLTQQRDARGTWHSTQATVLALKALLAGTQTGNEDIERKIDIALGNGFKKSITIPKDQSEVMQQFDLSAYLQPGIQNLEISESTKGSTNFQIAYRYHVPTPIDDKTIPPLQVVLNYDRDTVKVGETIQVSARVLNCTRSASPMVMLELPIPAGFTANTEVFGKLVQNGVIGKYQMQANSVLLYLRGLNALDTFNVNYQLRASMPVKVTSPAAKVYEYYDPSKQSMTTSKRLEVVRN